MSQQYGFVKTKEDDTLFVTLQANENCVQNINCPTVSIRISSTFSTFVRAINTCIFCVLSEYPMKIQC